jgi:putative integral membrane protein (TIGR02587 family)
MGAVNQTRRSKNLWLKELNDLVRGACGGFLFGIPLLYTMEVWWIGSYAEPPLLFAALVATFIVIFLLNRTEGFRTIKNVGWADTVMDTVEAIAIGIICSTIVLILLREITLRTSWSEALGKIIFEAVPFSLGVALAGSFLSGDRYQNSDNQDGPPKRRQPDKANLNETLADIGATLIGSVIIAFNIAPTDEVSMLSAAISPPWLLAIMAASLILSYGIVFQAGFTNQKKRSQQRGIFQRPMSETIMSYLVALAAAALMLRFFHQLSFDDPGSMWLSYTIILGLPATIGGAAGRLVA